MSNLNAEQVTTVSKLRFVVELNLSGPLRLVSIRDGNLEIGNGPDKLLLGKF